MDDATIEIKEDKEGKKQTKNLFTSFIQISGPAQFNLRKSKDGQKMDCQCRFVKDIVVQEPLPNEKSFLEPNYNHLMQGMAQQFYTQPQMAQTLFQPQQSPIVQNVEKALTETKTLLNNLENMLKSTQNNQAMYLPQRQQYLAQQFGLQQPSYAYNNYQVNNQQGYVQPMGMGYNPQTGINTNFQATF